MESGRAKSVSPSPTTLRRGRTGEPLRRAHGQWASSSKQNAEAIVYLNQAVTSRRMPGMNATSNTTPTITLKATVARPMSASIR